jgi:CMP-N,N'-diacetyllegionaminic acid synthase
VIGGLSVLAIIPARGGSKGLPGKNILPAGGKPLLAWTIEAAHESRCIDRLVLSSDDDAIMEAARRFGCEVPFRRPAALATDGASSIDVVLDALDRLPAHDITMLLQPTSPLRTAQDIDAACARLVDSGAPSCVSVQIVGQSPYWMFRLGQDMLIEPLLDLPAGITRRQDLPPVVSLNGAVYAARTNILRTLRSFVPPGAVAYIMPAERSLDIDDAHDFDTFCKTLSEKTHA